MIVSPHNGRLYSSEPSRTRVHPETGLRVHGNCKDRCLVECSLPRQVARSNGHLLSSQADLDRAMEVLFERLGQVADLGNRQFTATRIDLVQHLPIDPADLVTAYRDYRYPGIHRLPQVVSGESISWSGTGLHVSIYDKCREQGQPGEATSRFEFRVDKQVLRREFGGELVCLNFDQCYQVFRRLAGRFEPKKLPRLNKIAELLAHAEQLGCRLFEHWARGKSEPTIRALRRDTTRCRLSYDDIDIMAHLPPDHPPTPIHVEAPLPTQEPELTPQPA